MSAANLAFYGRSLLGILRICFPRCGHGIISTTLMTEPKPPYAAERLSRLIFTLSFAGALVFLYLRTFLLPTTPFAGIGDQILFFSRAARIVHGQILYRDFFEMVTPGTELLYAATFRVFGIHAWVMQTW
ncbi:MAG TPA: hypothetical protein VK608_06825, partial [Edaphobacter sp.]|nr:hypothetical protein [Edaphobacter sp.]